MRDLHLPDAAYDAVICAFGIFFVADMSEAVRELWRLVAPGEKLAIATWGPRQYEPLISVFLGLRAGCRPDLQRKPNPWDGISESGRRSAIF